MKFKFTCKKCETMFLIDTKYIVNRENIMCPSCDVQLPNNIFEDLKNIAISAENLCKNQKEEIRRNRSNTPSTSYLSVEFFSD